MLVPDVGTAECASWVQAWGSILAIIAAAIVVIWQHHLELGRQKLATDRDNLSAGSLALLTISSQYNDLLIYRRGLRQELNRRAEGMGPHAPLWALAPPIGHHFLESRVVDFKSLSFLFSRREGSEIFSLLSLAEHHYATLRRVNEQLTVNVMAIQEEMASLEKGPTLPTNAEVEHNVSIDKRARTADLLLAVVRDSRDDHIYTKSFAALRTALARDFGERSVPKSIEAPKGHRLEDMPPLPRKVAERIDEATNGGNANLRD